MKIRPLPIAGSILSLCLLTSLAAFAQAPQTENKPAPAESKPADAKPAATEEKKEKPEEEKKQITESHDIEGGYRFTIETTDAPDLTEWASKELVPVVKKWYPDIVNRLPSEGFQAPKTFSINFTNSYKGVAATMGNRIVCDPSWYRRELKGEALGSIVHELVHVVQQYRGRRGGARPPGWLVEGIPDHIRWFVYEPETPAAASRRKRAARGKYDAGYDVSANFLDFVIAKYDKELIKDLNAILREGKYDVELWKTRTGKPLEELATEWKKSLNPEPPKPADAPKPAEPAK